MANEITVKSLMASPAVKNKFAEILGKKAAGFMSSVISACSTNESLERCVPGTVVAAAAVAASLDLPINPSLGFAHIVPYSNKAQFQMGWRGFVQLAMRTGQYKTINASIVYEGELVGENHITGEMVFDVTKKVSDKIIGYVGYFRLLNGFEKYFYMTKEQVEAHGKRYSKAYASKSGRWFLDFDLMALKTVLKMLLSKYGILSIEMQTALRADQAVVREDGTYEYADNDEGKKSLQEDAEDAKTEEVAEPGTDQAAGQESASAGPETTAEKPKEEGEKKEARATSGQIEDIRKLGEKGKKYQDKINDMMIVQFQAVDPRDLSTTEADEIVKTLKDMVKKSK